MNKIQLVLKNVLCMKEKLEKIILSQKEEKRISMAVADAVVQDFLLLKPDGFEILQKIMKKCPRFSCVFISAACSYYDMK